MPSDIRSLQRIVSTLVALALTMGLATGVAAQTVDIRQWQGLSASSRHAEHVLASTVAEWRTLWSRVGLTAPDLFEPGRTNAVGIFLGTRPSQGVTINVLSASRRRDRIVVVFEERSPDDVQTAQRPAPRVASSGAGQNAPAATLVAPNATTSLAPSPARPSSPASSPWSIVLINRADLPITVEQRLYR